MVDFTKFKEILFLPFKGWAIDKWAHLGIGGLVCALLTIAFIVSEPVISPWKLLLFFFPGLIVVLIFSVFKELIDSTGFDWRDIFASVLGCLIVELSVLFGVVLYVIGI